VSGWFGDNAECPIDRPSQEWIDWRWAWLIKQFGAERAKSVPVILPLEEFFPEAFEKDYDGARVMLDRVCEYMGLTPETIELNLYQDQNLV